MVVARSWGEEEWGVVAQMEQFCFGKMDGGDSCTKMWMYLMPLKGTINSVKIVTVMDVLPQ